MNQNILRAWASGDEAAMSTAWQYLWGTLYTSHVGFCKGLAHNVATGEIWADETWFAVLEELRCAILHGHLRWMGPAKFKSYVRNRLRWRALDRARAAARAARAAARPPSRRLRTVLALLNAIQTGRKTTDVLENPRVLTCLRRTAANTPALAPVIDLALGYLRDRLVAALPANMNPQGMTWQELAAMAQPGRVRISKPERSALIMKTLGISRNSFDLRVRRLRKLARAC